MAVPPSLSSYRARSLFTAVCVRHARERVRACMGRVHACALRVTLCANCCAFARARGWRSVSQLCLNTPARAYLRTHRLARSRRERARTHAGPCTRHERLSRARARAADLPPRVSICPLCLCLRSRPSSLSLSSAS